MTLQHIAAAIHRVETVLRRRPDMGLHDDSPATARWQSGTRVLSSHANGTTIESDMPSEVGGTGDRITPGWLFRAGIASCATTSIAINAAASGIELTMLEVQVSSRSDTRGLIGMKGDDGEPVYAGPSDLQLLVKISARGVSPERLREVVEQGCRCSPIPAAVQNAVPMNLLIEASVA